MFDQEINIKIYTISWDPRVCISKKKKKKAETNAIKTYVSFGSNWDQVM